ncbi:flagellar FlbD family protein [Sodalis sp. dw_96]|uniref:flagellar FlbD family protein n=1 Tax=Sodalis sp. dw_96 TaxID=2719794 RepID=UPI001BD30B10|nr:flagellar FlbD family protein [Sodalis sp. dw_96]
MPKFIMLHQCNVGTNEQLPGAPITVLEPVFINADRIEIILSGINSVVSLYSGECLEVKEKPGEIIELIHGLQS